MKRRVWFERVFELGVPSESFPELLERLRGTPARLEERVRDFPSSVLCARLGEGWSIQEHVGHLSDLELLWYARVEDLKAGRARLSAADLSNAATWEARHNEVEIESVLAEFRARRAKLMLRLQSIEPGELGTTSLHPRLEQPMTVVDLGFFVAEHDDHHLATITRLGATAV